MTLNLIRSLARCWKEEKAKEDVEEENKATTTSSEKTPSKKRARTQIEEEGEKDQNKAKLTNLNELLLKMPFLLLDIADLDTAMKFEQVCKMWNKYMRDDRVWRQLCYKMWPSFNTVGANFQLNQEMSAADSELHVQNGYCVTKVDPLLDRICMKEHFTEAIENAAYYKAMALPCKTWKELYTKRHRQSLHMADRMCRVIADFQTSPNMVNAQQRSFWQEVRMHCRLIERSDPFMLYWEDKSSSFTHKQLQFVADSVLYAAAMYEEMHDGLVEETYKVTIMVYGSLLTLQGSSCPFALNMLSIDHGGKYCSYFCRVGPYDLDLKLLQFDGDHDFSYYSSFAEWVANIRDLLCVDKEIPLPEVWQLLLMILFPTNDEMVDYYGDESAYYFGVFFHLEYYAKDFVYDVLLAHHNNTINSI